MKVFEKFIHFRDFEKTIFCRQFRNFDCSRTRKLSSNLDLRSKGAGGRAVTKIEKNESTFPDKKIRRPRSPTCRRTDGK